MARRRDDSDNDVSLFPFLSIIACVIGVLTLMISTLALAQLDTKAVVQVEEFEKAKKSVEQAQAQLAAIQEQLAAKQQQAQSQANAQQQQFAALRERLDKLNADLSAKQSELEAQQKIAIVIPTLPESQRETLDDMKSQLVELREQLAQLEKEISDRKLPPEEAQVSILPAGSGLDQEPYFVECAAGAIVLHTGEKPVIIRAAEIAASPPFVKLLETVAANKKRILLFLVRSDGLGTYRQAKKLADDNKVANGKLPVVGKGRIDLQYVRGTK